ncbi:ABC transporter ATP-binding protein/permease [Paenibacillus wenxiniae]|uniref:ABC transporter ATP-binding protein/permease n=1 Tax=Paenibacillus wenxiniae TaxID=1636843 RepID=A0ABW4RMW8_9BACL
MGKDLWKLQGIRLVMLLTALLTLLQTIVIVLQSVWLAQAVSGLFSGDTLQSQLGHIGGFVSALIARQFLSMLLQKLAYDFAERTGQQFRRALIDQLFALGPRYAMGQGTGNLVTLVREGIAKYRTYLELIIPRMVSNGLTPLFIGIYVLRLDWISAMILGLVFPILIAFMILLGLAAQKQMDRQWATYRVLSNHFVDSLRGLETLRFLGRSRAHAVTIGRTSEQYRKATIGSMRVAFLSSFALDFFTMLSVAFVAVSLGLRLVHGEMLLEPALTILMLAPEFFVPIRSLGADYHATMDGKEAGEEIQRMMQQPIPGQSSNSSIACKESHATFNESYATFNESYATFNESYAAINESHAIFKRSRIVRNESASDNRTWNEASTLMIEAVSIHYGHDSQHSTWQTTNRSEVTSIQADQAPIVHDRYTALTNVSLNWQGYGKIGIIGASGAGKSTLIDLLAGFLVPDEGQAIWRDAHGHSSQLHGQHWRTAAAYIPQHPYIFSGTLRDNIALYEPNATESEVAEAAQCAGLGKLLQSLPQGLNEHVGEGGRMLSGGQEQRVALARALLGQRHVLLLDEPTAHLDIETEYELKQTMLPLFDNKLVLLATHRLHWMTDMDWIIVMEQGQIVEQGTHQGLLEQNGLYCSWINEQWEGSA